MFNELIIPPGAGSNFISSLMIRNVHLPFVSDVKNYTYANNEYNEMRCWDNKDYHYEKFDNVDIFHGMLLEYKNLILDSSIFTDELKDLCIKEYNNYISFYNKNQKSFYGNLSYVILLNNILRNDILDMDKENSYSSNRNLYDANHYIKIYLQKNFIIPYLSFGMEEERSVFNITHNPILTVTIKDIEYFKSKFNYQLNFVWYDNLIMLNWCNLLNSIKLGYDVDIVDTNNFETYYNTEYSDIRNNTNTISIEKIYFKQDSYEIEKLFSINPSCSKYFDENKVLVLDKFKKYHMDNLKLVQEHAAGNKDISDFYKILIDNYDV